MDGDALTLEKDLDGSRGQPHLDERRRLSQPAMAI
jgi:hypothetical protein